MRRIIISALIILYTSLLWAINGVSISQNTIGNGLESQSMNMIAKDRQGRLWVGSDVGISLISNGTVTNIRELATEGGLVILGNVREIVCTNSILIACDDRILHYDYKKNNAFTVRYDETILNTQDFLLEGNVATFYDRDTRSLYSYDMESMECSLVASLTEHREHSFSKILRSNSDSTVIYLADDLYGLYRFNRKDGSMIHVPNTDTPIIAKATVIDNSNVIWLSVPSKGIKGYHISGGFDLVAEYNTGNCDLISDDISYICSLPNGNLLTCHSKAGSCTIERNNRVSGRTNVIRIPDLKNITSVLANSQDRETLYATDGYGLISMKKTFIEQFSYLYEQENGIISYENFISAIEEPQGSVILGTKDNGICRINPATSQKVTIPETRSFKVNTMCRFDDNSILMYDESSGLLLFDCRNGKTTSLAGHPVLGGISRSRSTNMRLASTPDGTIFIFNVNSSHYIYRKNENRIKELTLSSFDGRRITSVENICISRYAVYATGMGEILEINFNATDTRCIYHNKERVIHNITSLASNSRGELFFTEPEGLHCYNPHSNADELLINTWGNGRFMNVAVDSKDRVWFNTTDEYLHMYDPEKKELLMYSVEDGVPDSRSQNKFSICTTSGIILYPNANGMVAINTNGSLMYDTPPIEVTCVSLRTERREIPEKYLAGSLDKPVRLPSKFRELTLEFSANEFNPIYPHLLIYDIYRNNLPIKSISTTSTEITLPRLDNGTYSVVIRQAYRRGLSEPQTILMFRIPNSYFGTIPGVLTALALMLAFGYSIAKISSTREKNRMEKAIAAQDIKNREDKIAFLSNIAHELRTPLSLIYNPVKDFLQEKSVDGIDYERMERIFNQVNKMTVMVNMILDSSRADINKADILIEEVNLNEWINFLLEDYRIDCYGKGFSLKFIMDNSIGTVSIDKRIIETGLSNMVNNAIKYSPTGTTITVSTSKVGEEMIRVSVKDQGRGFSCDPEELFKRYYRDNIDNSIPGYGLGLPYARLQLSLINGNMSAFRNEDGEGSTFYMEFPSVIGNNGAPVHKNVNGQTGNEASEKPEDNIHHEMTEEGMAQDFDTNNMTILYVGTDDDELKSFTDKFSGMFKLILTAHDGIEAINLLKQTDTDLVVSNADMPNMDGFELCRTIKGTLEISHIPVILLTSRTDKRNKALGYKMGADAFISKPYDFKKMNALIRSQLGGRFEVKRQYNYGFFSTMNPDQTFSMTDEEFIRSLNTLINEHISDLSLNDGFITEQMNLSPSVISTKMNMLLGTDLTSYINRIRIRLVKDKLMDTDKELEAIAKETGFRDVEALNKAFRRETGKSVFEIRDL